MFQNWRLFLFGLPMLVVLSAAQVFIYRRMVRDVTQRQWLRRTAAVLLPTLFFGGFVASALSSRFPSDALRIGTVAMLVWGGFLQYALMFLLLVELGWWWRQRQEKRGSVAPLNPERRAFLQRASVVTTAVVSGGVTAYGSSTAFAEPVVNEVPIKLPNLPRELDGFSIMQLTDIHVGSIVQTAFLDQLVAVTNSHKPDLVAITGDLVDGSVANLGKYVARFQRLQSRYGTHFVTGNHDYYSKVNEWVPALEGFGWTVLRNRHVRIGDAGASFDLVGVDDWGTPRTARRDYDLNLALQGRDPGRASVLLSHQPVNEEAVAQAGVGLQLSGHTHGGQVFPGSIIAASIWGPRAWGLSKVGDTHFYTSRGCGFVGPPMRVGAPPEIVKLILTRG